MNFLPSRSVGSLDFSTRTHSTVQRRLAQETPIVLEYNGIDYAVMLASPQDLEDYGVGFTLAEGLAGSLAEIGTVDSAAIDQGFVVRITLAHNEPLRDRLRLRLVEGSCGLCGLQSIEDVLRPLPVLCARPRLSARAIEAAARALPDRQPIGRATGAMHAAAFCDEQGAIVAVREDIGRHNALDKLTGHLARAGIDPALGFILLSARCSYELVEKTVRAGCPALVTISAPSDLAAERAEAARLTLVALTRPDSALVVNDPHGIFSTPAPDGGAGHHDAVASAAICMQATAGGCHG